jgi:hypothetical protein
LDSVVWGSSHGRYLKAGEINNAELTAVCDINPERLRFAKENFGEDIQVFDNAEAFFASQSNGRSNDSNTSLFSSSIGYSIPKQRLSHPY